MLHIRQKDFHIETPVVHRADSTIQWKAKLVLEVITLYIYMSARMYGIFLLLFTSRSHSFATLTREISS